MYLGIEKNTEEIKNDVITLSGLHPSKLRNIYTFGSRIYGNYTLNSDIDMILIASSMKLNIEIHEGIYNIHITTPDAFKEQLDSHDIHCLECIYSEKSTQLMSQIDYLRDFRIYRPQLKKMIMSQSAWAWSKAQRRIEQGNIIGGAKSLWHCLRILKFGIQVIELGKIVDFSEANPLWEEIKGFEGLEWKDYQEKWLNNKKYLQKEFRKM